MTTVSGEIEIDLPVTTVYEQWTQFEDFPAFLSGVEEVAQRSDDSLHWRVNIGGVPREFDAAIVDQEPDDRIAWQSTGGPAHAGVVAFDALDADRTRVRVQLQWEPQGLIEKAGAALQLDDLQVAQDLREFKRLIESKVLAAGAWRGGVEDIGL